MYIADLHLHSRFSMATAKNCDLQNLEFWGKKKGIELLGTGDFTHPLWRREIKEQLNREDNGFLRLKEEYSLQPAGGGRAFMRVSPRFVITGEISCVYKKNGKTRRVHNVILLPDVDAADRLAAALEKIGSLHSDGRPILKLDSRDLLELALDCSAEVILIPAHVWTPHYSMFGEFTAFESVEECFGDLSQYIWALETGLSADPEMFWQISALDRYQLVSNSDAHSPAKLGREATLIDGDYSWSGLSQAIKTGTGLRGTIEFFPEEGKYHSDGHRSCGVCLSPAETAACRGICPVCGKKLTIGVSNRISRLADRELGYRPAAAKGYESLIPLPEILAASIEKKPDSVVVKRQYDALLAELGPEFEILRECPLDEIGRAAGARAAEGIGRMRRGMVERVPGYDGVYGEIVVFPEGRR